MLHRLTRRRCLLTYPFLNFQVNKRYDYRSNVRCATLVHGRIFPTQPNKICDFHKAVQPVCRAFCNAKGPLTPLTYEQVCNETLDSLAEYFEELIENATHLTAADVSYSDGVLTVKFGPPYGTYVINRQTPNLQIWLSSPKSGPKRYDFQEGCWVYRHDGISLHELLNKEIPDIVKQTVDFFNCSYAKTTKDNK